MISTRRLAHGAALAVLLCSASSAVYAQDITSSVRGQLTGSNGAPVGGATVTLVHVPSGTRSTVASNRDGVFDARGLRIGGPYTVTVAAPEFETKSVSGLNLQVGETLKLDFDLVAANAVDEVVVTAATDVEANNAGVASTLDRESIEAVVSVSRDIRDLARRNLLTSANTTSDGGISIAGSNPKMNRITIDGASVSDDFGLNSGGLPTIRGPISLDAVDQFTVQAVPYDVDNGDFQGGAIDIVLRSGTNDFHGSAFVNYLNDGMVGRKIKNTKIKSVQSQKNYGGFLSGPLLQDRLFFAASYEKYQTQTAVATGPTGAGFANSIRNITQATIDQVVGILNNTYATEFDAGGIDRTTPVLDKKYSLKVDWNINDKHRAYVTYRNSQSSLWALSNLNTTTASLRSNWYLTGENDENYVGQINSQWTNRLATEFRVSYREYVRQQDPPSGQEFAELQICSAATSVVATPTVCDAPASLIRIGPDEFRQANELATKNLQFQFKATYAVGPNRIKFGVESQNLEIVNLFVSRSDGVYYFDSVADFQAGRANRLQYSNAPSGNPFDAAAVFKYQQNSAYFQNTLDVTDALQVTAGFRYDWYKSDDLPIRNPNFVARNGFTNQTTYDGKSIVMPRVAFSYDPKSFFKINGGFGLFSGGVPDVLISTAFSTTGYAAAGIDIQRNADGTFREANLTSAFTQAIGAAGLNINVADPRFGYDLPGAVTGLVSPTGIPAQSAVIAFNPAFEIPSAWKFFLSGTADLPFSLRGAADLVVSETRSTLAYTDIKARPLIVNGQRAMTPDGRPRYDGLVMTDAARAAAGVAGSNVAGDQDILVGNDKRGRGWIAGVSLSRSFLNDDLFASVGYVRQKLDEGTSGLRFGTTAGSLYASQLADAMNANRDAYGRGYEEVRDRLKVEVSYKKDFIRNHATRLSLFGDVRSGRPFNVTMGGAFGRNPVFGVNRSAFQLYVPDFAADTNPNDLNVGIVTFADQNTLNAMRAAVARFNLKPGIAPKGFNRNPDVNRLDLQLSQELPSPIKGHKFKVVLDVQNVLNLLNRKWGTVEEYGPIVSSGQGNNRILDVACGTAAGAPAGAGSPVCDRYIYSNPNATALVRSVSTTQSLWYMQVSFRYEW